MSNSICTSNLTAGFVDLATFDESEKFMYGSAVATAYFCRETRKSTWFTQVPVVLTRCSGDANFGQEWAVNISRAGDYMMNNWLTVTLPSVSLVIDAVSSASIRYLQWTPNFMHNLIRECCITFNDLVAARFDNFHLDFWAAFTVPSGKAAAYNQMIGNTCEMTTPATFMGTTSNSLPGGTFHLPLPFFYTRDSGVALPTAALPYNDMKINFAFRDFEELLTLWTITGGGAATGRDSDLMTGAETSKGIITQKCNSDTTEITSNLFLNNKIPSLRDVQVWANYAIVSNDERKRMACAPRDMLIEQVQTNPVANIDVNPQLTVSCGLKIETSQRPFDIRFAHAIKALFFGVRNKTCVGYLSNYNTRTPMFGYDVGTSTGDLSADMSYLSPCEVSMLAVVTGSNQAVSNVCVNENGYALSAQSADTVGRASLLYEGTQRLSQLESSYYSMINPYFNAPRVPIGECFGNQTVALGKQLSILPPTDDTGPNPATGLNGPSECPAVSCKDDCTFKSKEGKEAVQYGEMIAGMAYGNVPTGLHVYSYSLDFYCLDPMGSTNYGKLTNITMSLSLSGDAAMLGTAGVDHLYVPMEGAKQYVDNTVTRGKNKYEYVLTAVNNNIVRISGGALGFPVL